MAVVRIFFPGVVTTLKLFSGVAAGLFPLFSLHFPFILPFSEIAGGGGCPLPRATAMVSPIFQKLPKLSILYQTVAKNAKMLPGALQFSISKGLFYYMTDNNQSDNFHILIRRGNHLARLHQSPSSITIQSILKSRITSTGLQVFLSLYAPDAIHLEIFSLPTTPHRKEVYMIF